MTDAATEAGTPATAAADQPGRLLCIYQHAPTPGAPGIYRHRMLLAELVQRGWHVDLVSSPINYMTGHAPDTYADRSYVNETIDGIEHHWVRAVGDIHASKRRRLANYLSFAAAASVRAALLPRPDVIWASSPPLTIASVGMLLSRRFQRPWVYEIRDLWPESAASVGWIAEDSQVYRIAHHRARRYAEHAAAVIVPTPGLVDAARSHGAADVTVISGAVRDVSCDAATRTAARQDLGIADDALAAVYVGAHGPANGLDVLLNVAARTREEPIHYVLVGDGADRARLDARRAAEGLNNVTMRGPVGKDEVPALLAAADVCLHVLRDDPLFHTALPTKVLEYLGAHRPFITTVDGLPADVARATGGDFAADEDELLAAVRRWAERTPDSRGAAGEAAFTWGLEHYGLQSSVDRLESLLATVRVGTSAPDHT